MHLGEQGLVVGVDETPVGEAGGGSKEEHGQDTAGHASQDKGEIHEGRCSSTRGYQLVGPPLQSSLLKGYGAEPRAAQLL